jgi:Protein of unknown function (DUF1186)
MSEVCSTSGLSYLLAFFRETRAYPLLVRIFSRSGEFLFQLVGDVTTQDLGRMLASVCGGDVSGMTALIENEQANECVRSVAMEGIVSLVTTGQRTREEVMAYIHLTWSQTQDRTSALPMRPRQKAGTDHLHLHD